MARDTYRGASNNKERSKQKLIDAVGEVIKSAGYTALNISNVSKTAGVDRKLINLYFGNLDNLVETYVKSKDYWVGATGNAASLLEHVSQENLQKVMESVLMQQLDYFYQEDEMQKIVLWQLSERSKIMSDVAEEREKTGAVFFDLADSYFGGTDVDIRAIAGLLVAGIYYMVLHAKSTDSLFCEIDINTADGMLRIKEAIHKIIDDAFRRAKHNKLNC